MQIRQMIQTAAQDPRFQSAIQAVRAEVSNLDVDPAQLQELIEMLEMAIQMPERYPEIRQAAINDGLIDADDLPEQADPIILVSILVVLYELQSGGQQSEIPPEMMSAETPIMMYSGGLTKAARALAAQGRRGDTMLAHITPNEARMLRARGGAGTINPRTGLPEFFLKKLFKAVLPIALSIIAPGLGTAIGTALGASAAWAPILGGAIVGGVTTGIAGGDPLKGMALGALGGGMGGQLGSFVAPGATATQQALIGNMLAGGAMGAATGQGFGRGALSGAVGQMVGTAAGRLGPNIGAGGKTFGQMLTAGYDPKTAAVAGTLGGLFSATRPADVAVDSMRKPPVGLDQIGLEPQPGDLDYGIRAGAPGDYLSTGDADALLRAGGRDVLQDQARRDLYSLTGGARSPGGLTGGAPEMVTGSAAAGTPAGGGLTQALGGANLKTLGTLALLGSLSSAPAPVQQAVQQMSPEQREYFNRPSVTWDWGRMMQDANRAGMGLSEYMAAAWPRITSGAYNAQGMYRGGSPLSQMSYLVRGGGSGRDDTIDAKVSNGEYVMDAETVAMLGDGSTDEGARRLDQMRSALRRHKGRALAKGRFSPDAKSPLTYIKKVA